MTTQDTEQQKDRLIELMKGAMKEHEMKAVKKRETLPAEFVENMTHVFTDAFDGWAMANKFPSVIVKGVESALYLAVAGKENDDAETIGSHMMHVANAIVVMGGVFHSEDSSTIERPRLMLEPRKLKEEVKSETE